MPNIFIYVWHFIFLYINKMHNMKHLNQYITEYIIKKKLDKPIDSEDHYEYTPKTKEELIENIKEMLDKGETQNGQ